MCAACHQAKGSGFGEGKGQLYTRLTNGQFLQTYGFTSYQLDEIIEGNDDDDLW
jgi:mono/diheme cytochrome c family protein